MREMYQLAELLIASWKLANGSAQIPTSHGSLDRALEQLIRSKNSLPSWVRENLTFANTDVGMRCLELPQVLFCAQDSLLTSEPNPTYTYSEIKIDDTGSRRLLRKLGVAPDVATKFGHALKQIVDSEAKKAPTELIEAG
jgi:hypothetical protein